MRVKEIMSPDPVCCTPDTSLQEVAKLMCDEDCGEIPVVESLTSMRVIGVVTDRDITCRVVAAGKDPQALTVDDCMSTPVVTVTPDTTIDDCVQLMESRQIRRVPVVDDTRACTGIVSQADLARHAPARQTAEYLAEVSRPAGTTAGA